MSTENIQFQDLTVSTSTHILTLTSNDISDLNLPYVVTGTDQKDLIKIQPNVNVLSMNLKNGTDEIHLPYKSTDYIATSSESGVLTLISSDNTQTISMKLLANNDSLIFANGAVSVEFSKNVIKIGTVKVPLNQTVTLEKVKLNTKKISLTVPQDITITDDSIPTVEFDITKSPQVIEGNQDETSELTFNLKRSGNLAQPSLVNYAIDLKNKQQNNAVDQTDFIQTEGIATFNAGSDSASINLLVKGDNDFEPDESFTVQLSTVDKGNATIGKQSSATGIIENDDQAVDLPTIEFKKAIVNVVEGNDSSKNKQATIQLQRDGDNLEQSSSVGWEIVFDSADKNDIASQTSGIVVFNPNSTSANINISIKGDTTAEADESFTVKLKDSRIATLKNPDEIATVVIQNDDGDDFAPTEQEVDEVKTLINTLKVLKSEIQNIHFDLQSDEIKMLFVQLMNKIASKLTKPASLTQPKADFATLNKVFNTKNMTHFSDSKFVSFSDDAINFAVIDEQTGVVKNIPIVKNNSNPLDKNDYSRGQMEYESLSLKMSNDSHYAVFESNKTFSISDKNSFTDIYRKDLNTETLELVSVTADGKASNTYGTRQPSISSDGRYIVFQSDSDSLVANDTNKTSDVFLKDMTTKEIKRISISSNGTESNGFSSNAGMSNDGRYIVFDSYASNLVTNDSNNKTDIFLKDAQTGKISLISSTSNGGDHPAISGDGRYVVYQTAENTSTNEKLTYQIWLSDLQTNETKSIASNVSSFFPTLSQDGKYVVYGMGAYDSYSNRMQVLVIQNLATNEKKPLFVNQSTDLLNSNLAYMGSLGNVSISPDSLYIAFTTAPQYGYPATYQLKENPFLSKTTSTANLPTTPVSTVLSVNVDKASQVEGSTFNYTFKLDKAVDKDTKITYQISTITDGLNASDFSTANALDSKTVTIKAGQTSATVDIATQQDSDVELDQQFKLSIVKTDNSAITLGASKEVTATITNDDKKTETTLSPVSFNEITKVEAGYNFSADGNYAFFDSYDVNSVEGDTNEAVDVFMKNLQTGEIKLISTASDGMQGNGHSNFNSLSSDGRYIAFKSGAINLVAGDTNNVDDVFVKDMQTGILTRVSTASDGTQGNKGSGGARLSSDGRYVAFSSGATNLVAGDTNNVDDVFVKDIQTGILTRVSTASDGTQGNKGILGQSISSDGRYISFASDADNLVTGDTNNSSDIFLKDIRTGDIKLVSIATSNGTQTNLGSIAPSISNDGRYITFRSLASNLVAGDGNDGIDIFIKDIITGTIKLISTASDGTQGNFATVLGTMSKDGRYIVFASNATNLVEEDTNKKLDVFVKNVQTGEIKRVSTASDGTQGNNNSGMSSSQVFSFLTISADGKYISFYSEATNLTAEGKAGYFVTPNPLWVAPNAMQTQQPLSLSLEVESTPLVGQPLGWNAQIFTSLNPNQFNLNNMTSSYLKNDSILSSISQTTLVG